MTKFTFSSSTDVKNWKHGKNNIGEWWHQATWPRVHVFFLAHSFWPVTVGKRWPRHQLPVVQKLHLTTPPGRDGMGKLWDQLCWHLGEMGQQKFEFILVYPIIYCRDYPSLFMPSDNNLLIKVTHNTEQNWQISSQQRKERTQIIKIRNNIKTNSQKLKWTKENTVNYYIPNH